MEEIDANELLGTQIWISYCGNHIGGFLRLIEGRYYMKHPKTETMIHIEDNRDVITFRSGKREQLRIKYPK